MRYQIQLYWQALGKWVNALADDNLGVVARLCYGFQDDNDFKGFLKCRVFDNKTKKFLSNLTWSRP